MRIVEYCGQRWEQLRVNTTLHTAVYMSQSNKWMSGLASKLFNQNEGMKEKHLGTS